MVLSARLSVFLQIAKKHPVIFQPLLASDHPDLPFARFFNILLF
jgi:hypothetical protein